MDKFKEIRPVALGLIQKENKILVNEGYDKIKDQKFYRCLGGGIEFQEKSYDALKREFLEEIGKEITVKNFLGVSENIFTFEGKKAHELIFFYSAELKEEDYQEEYIMDEDGKVNKAVWIDINDFKSNKSIIYPEEVLKYI